MSDETVLIEDKATGEDILVPPSLPVASVKGRIGPQGKGIGANNTASYNRRYYLAHKESLTVRKKQRYQEDEEYREKIKARRRAQYEQEKTARKVKGRKPRLDGSIRMLLTLSDGVEVSVNMLTMGQFAKRVGISVVTLRQWIKQQVIPDAMYQTSGGHRLFTEHQIYRLKDAIYARAKLGAWRCDQAFTDAVVRAWNELDRGVDRKAMTAILGEQDE